ncbi:MAG TPA: hypothetical protein VG013_27150 [Gemmataceae bacterium]|nr:hypothetical protein [Gemmataceae bacterium]
MRPEIVTGKDVVSDDKEVIDAASTAHCPRRRRAGIDRTRRPGL